MNPDRFILLVEDNPDDRALTLRAIRENHIANEVLVAADGAEAMDILQGTGAHAQKREARPALVLLDLKLPKINGIEVLRRIREDPRTRRVPVVILTSSREEVDLADSYDLGANSYIQKPVSFERLSESVRRIGLYWMVLNQPPPGGKGRPDAHAT